MVRLAGSIIIKLIYFIRSFFGIENIEIMRWTLRPDEMRLRGWLKWL